MKIVIGIASYHQDEETGLLLNSIGASRCFDSLLEAIETVKAIRIICTDGKDQLVVRGGFDYKRIPESLLSYTTLPDIPRRYASVVYEKIKAVEPLCDDDTIFWNTDPDYHLNPYALTLSKKIFEENPQVDYLCLLTEPTVESIPGWHKCQVKLSGFRFVKHPSAMGGAMICRWSKFYPAVKQFLEKYKVTGESTGKCSAFDQQFWTWLAKRTGEERTVYMIFNGPGSLVQHCNLVSRYLSEKGPRGVLAHMAGKYYDPRINPFKWLEVARGQET